MSTRTDVTDNLDLAEALAGQPERLAVVVAALQLYWWGNDEAAHSQVVRAWAIASEALK